jgi:hypothetical protein
LEGLVVSMWSQSSCRQFRRQLALGVGDDLSADEQLRTERHVAVCPDCRTFRDGLHDSQTALKRAAVMQLVASSAQAESRESDAQGPSADSQGSAVTNPAGKNATGKSGAACDWSRPVSLWSDVRERLPRRENRRRANDYDLRNWAVAGLSLAVCVMLTLVLRTIPQNGAGAGLASEPIGASQPVVPVIGSADDAVPPAMKGTRRAAPSKTSPDASR